LPSNIIHVVPGWAVFETNLALFFKLIPSIANEFLLIQSTTDNFLHSKTYLKLIYPPINIDTINPKEINKKSRNVIFILLNCMEFNSGHLSAQRQGSSDRDKSFLRAGVGAKLHLSRGPMHPLVGQRQILTNITKIIPMEKITIQTTATQCMTFQHLKPFLGYNLNLFPML
jgi:hypothetical protein